MTARGPWRPGARAGAAGAAGFVCLLAGVLVADYVSARREEPREQARITELQVQAQTDPSAARALAAEQDRVTRGRQQRKARKNAIAILLIVCASAFVGAAKWINAMEGRRPHALPVKAIPMAVAAPVTLPSAGASAPSPGLPAPLDLTFVDELVGREGRSRESAIPILQAIQAHYGYLPDDALRRVTELTEITPAQVAGTSTFYARFRRSPVGEHIVRVCHGTACHVSGARAITEELRRQLHIRDGAETDPAGLFTIDEVACLGCCSLAPVLMVDERTAGGLTPASAYAALGAARHPEPA